MESSSLQELEQIPGVGKTIAQDMQNIGLHSIDALKGRQAQYFLLLPFNFLFFITQPFQSADVCFTYSSAQYTTLQIPIMILSC